MMRQRMSGMSIKAVIACFVNLFVIICGLTLSAVKPGLSTPRR